MPKSNILLQLDTDPTPSSFDAIVAIDSGVDRLLQYADVKIEDIERLVHGCIFTRGPKDLHQTAIFVGGSDVRAGEQLVAKIRDTFIGAMRVSVMLDCNGCNTTAVAAVLSAGRHLDLGGSHAVVLGASGPVGRRVAALLAHRGVRVVVVSRDETRAKSVCNELIANGISPNKLDPRSLSEIEPNRDSLSDVRLIFGCGAAGAELMSESRLNEWESLRVAVDLNAVPPAGLGGIQFQDHAVPRGNRTDYGALGVGGLKMKIHRAAIQKLFERNDLDLDAEHMMEIGQEILRSQ